MKTIGYAIVGTGYFGAELGRIMKEQEGARIVAVLDPENAQSVAEELGCDVETDLDTLYSREDVEAVIVATPNYLHKEPVIKAAEHGVNVFCEKPIALSYKDCDEMVKACQQHGVTFMAGHVMNFFRGVRHAKKIDQRRSDRKSPVLPFCQKRMGRTAAVNLLEKDKGKIRGTSVSSHSRAGLCTVPHGRNAGNSYHDRRKCCAPGGGVR